jgi:ADP-ribose pyrophosphatase YjhB (NUDIX family)
MIKTSLRWLDWAREIQALAQTGYYYTENEYDRHRYQRLLEIAAEITAEQTALEYPQLVQVFTDQLGYATPRVDVRGAVIREGKLLMVRERRDGGWTMPGGWADVGDLPSASAEREVWEEAGFHVRAQRVVGVYDANRVGPLDLFHAFKIVFLCDILDGEPRPSDETSEVDFFAPDEMPEILSGERTLRRHIVDVFNAWRQPDLPTIFD